MDRIENEMIYMYSGNEPKRGKGVPPGGGGAVMPGWAKIFSTIACWVCFAR